MLIQKIQKRADFYQATAFFIIKVFSFTVLIFLLFMLGYIFKSGYSALSWEFLTTAPFNEMRSGGIFPAIMGTFYLLIGSSLVSIPFGIITAIYLNEYASNPKLVKFIRLGVSNLAGVPSVVFGLFGLSLFVVLFDFRVSILSGSLTLGILSLPVIIRSTEEALMTVPMTYREASLSLGATRWQTISQIVLPNALSGILTGIILSMGRMAGETAPVMFTAAVFFTPDLPNSIFSEIMVLPYHIYVMATAGTHIEATRHLQYGTVIVLISLVLLLNLTGFILRARFKKRHRG